MSIQLYTGAQINFGDLYMNNARLLHDNESILYSPDACILISDS